MIEDMSVVKSLATDALNSAYEYNGGDGGCGNIVVDPSEIAEEYHRVTGRKEIILTK